MKKLLFLLLLALPLTVAAQDKNPQIEALLKENIYRTGVNTNPYEYLPAAETPVPAGFKPFYISHYGRHGSRSDWEGREYERTLKLYKQAAEKDLLSEEGLKAAELIEQIVRLHNHMDGRLTARGAREHRQIANRMYKKYKKVFEGSGRKVSAVSSMTQRCIISMAAFTGELLSLDPKLDMSWDTGEAFMFYCSTGDPKELREEAYKLIIADAESHSGDTAQFYGRIFKDPAKACAEIGNAIDMFNGTMSFAAISGSFDLGDFLLRLYTDSDRYWYAQNVSLNLYLRQCNSKNFGELRMAEPGVQGLVDDIVTRADAAVAGKGNAADLRFGHDYQLLAICSRLGIHGIAERWDEKECLNWPAFLYTPFAGNLQIIFYRNNKNEVLVKFYINERETSLITLPGGPYYKWEDVKEAFKTCP